jgi:adenylate kinase family enzyme
MFITLLGRPGAGKTTLGRALQEATGMTYVGGGALLRTWVREQRPGWERVQWHVETRTDTPPELQLQLLREAVEDVPDGAILDGFPKTSNLHAGVEAVLGEEITVAVYLDTPAELASFRVAHRLVCAACGLPTSDLVADPHGPCVGGGCDGRLMRRPEDEVMSHGRESTDSVALRDIFAHAERLLTLTAATTVKERVEAVLADLRGRP